MKTYLKIFMGILVALMLYGCGESEWYYGLWKIDQELTIKVAKIDNQDTVAEVAMGVMPMQWETSIDKNTLNKEGMPQKDGTILLDIKSGGQLQLGKDTHGVYMIREVQDGVYGIRNNPKVQIDGSPKVKVYLKPVEQP